MCCSHCGRRFVRRDELTRHAWIHSREARYLYTVVGSAACAVDPSVADPGYLSRIRISKAFKYLKPQKMEALANTIWDVSGSEFLVKGTESRDK
jgi:hypothetical protein